MPCNWALKMTTFESAPRPADNEEKRLLQMKDLARQLALSEEYNKVQLRARHKP